MSANKIRILVVEDNHAFILNISEYFADSDYQLSFASNGFTAIHLLTTEVFDLILLDEMLPDTSGNEICRRYRKEFNNITPIIFMTAKGLIEDKVASFNSGADDYLVKPFHLKELELRIEVLVNRKLIYDSISVCGLNFNPGTMIVTYNDTVNLKVGYTHSKILNTLMTNFPNYVSYDKLIATIWDGRYADYNTLRTHVYNLRKQLKDTFALNFIGTYPKLGYCLVDPIKENSQ